jgi:8-oxo-dGTP pyrophosphatase MutT (NUDIX family)
VNLHGVPARRRSVCVLVPVGDRWLALMETKHGGAVCVPGGKVELGESLEAAVARECWEETGHLPLDPQPIFRGECGGFLATAFLAKPLKRSVLGGGDAGPVLLATKEEILEGTYGAFMAQVFATLEAP